MAETTKTLARWKRDPVAFITEVLRDPRTGKPYELFPEQARFIREAFTLTPEGRLPHETAVYSTPKKNGKSTTGAMCAIYAAVVLGGKFAGVYVVANDEEQSTGIIFTLAARTIQRHLNVGV
jgi:phage terminase large subunit-like protein